MVLGKVSRLLQKLRLGRGASLDDWIEHHRRQVQEDVRRILPYVPEDGRIVDIGANVGLFTECLLRERPRASAVLFEPVQRYHDHCVRRLSGFPNVTVHRLGVGNQAGPVTIYKAAHNFGANSVMEDIMFDRRANSEVREDTVIEPEEIHMVVFSDFAREHGIGDVDLVKTDTEGYDFAVLEGMLPWLRERTRLPAILSELLAKDYHPRWAQQEAVVREIVALGYEDVDLDGMRKVDDILFVPRDRRI